MTNDKVTWISLCVGLIIAVAALLGTAQSAPNSSPSLPN